MMLNEPNLTNNSCYWSIFSTPDILAHIEDSEEFTRFVQRKFEQDYHLFRSALSEETVIGLLSPDRLEGFLNQHALVKACGSVIEDGRANAANMPVSNDGIPVGRLIQNKVRKGASLRLKNIHFHDKKIDNVCRDLAQAFGRYTKANIYVTPPGASGFKPHFDDHDVFVVQCFGTKECSIYHEYEGRELLVPRGVHFSPTENTPKSSPIQFILSPGDILYIPRGMMHAASCNESASGHITFGMTTLSWLDYLEEAVECLSESIPELRRSAAVNVLASSHSPTNLASILQHLAQLCAEVSPDMINERLFEKIVARYPQENLMSWKQLLEPDGIGLPLNTSYRVQPGALFRVEGNGEKGRRLRTALGVTALSEEEASIIEKLRPGMQLYSQNILAKLGEEEGAGFIYGLLAFGVLEQ